MKKFSLLALGACFSLVSMFPAFAAEAPVKDWTVAVFLNADNNLDPFGFEDQKEMARVGSNDFMNVVTLIDRENGPAQINYIEKDNIQKIKDMGELDMGDYKEFVKFVKFVKANYPAKHYSFSFWNHGSGWKNKKEKALFRGVSYDDSSNNHITTNQLTIALEEASKILGQKIDIVNFDACLMQMVEVAYACKEHAVYMVGSEETEPGKGAPYDDILKGVKPEMDAKAFALNWAKAFADSYNYGSQGNDLSTQSVVDLSKIDELTDSISGVAKAIMAGKYGIAMRKVAFRAQGYDDVDNKDIYSLFEELKEEGANDKALLSAIDKAQKALKKAVIYSRYTGYKAKDSNGLAIFFPTSYMVGNLYKDLAFAKKCMWDEMILDLGKKVQIEMLMDAVKSGRLSELKSIISQAKRDPKNPIYRKILTELNYINSVENSIPAKYKDEFEALFAEFKEVLQTAN